METQELQEAGEERSIESRKIAFSSHIFPYAHGGIKPLLSKQSSANLSPNLSVPLLTRSNIGYNAGRSTELELEDLDSSHVCYLLDFRKVT